MVKVSVKNWSSLAPMMKKIKKVHAGTGRNPYLHRKIHPMHVIKSIVEMSVIVSRLLLLHLRSSYQAEFILYR